MLAPTIRSLAKQIPCSRRVVSSLRKLRSDTLHGMTSREEQAYFRTYVRKSFSGEGEIVDLGCWLGSTTIPLAQGLRRNRTRRVTGKRVHAYDLFTWEEWMDPYMGGCARHYSPGESFLEEYESRTRRYSKRIAVHPGDLSQIGWSGQPIEVLLVDAMKSWELAKSIVEIFYCSLLPQKSILIHQDFKHYYCPWIHLIQYKLKDYFILEQDIPNSGSVVFRLKRRIDCDLSWLKNLRSLNDQEVNAAFEYAMSLLGEKSGGVAAAHIMYFIHLDMIEKAKDTFDKFVQEGFPVKYDLKIVQNILATKRIRYSTA